MRFENNIAVIGDVMLDRFEEGKKAFRKNPENPDVPIVLAEEKFFLGGAGNVARNIVSLGARCDLYGVVGNDLYGHEIARLCGLENIGLKLFFDNKPTILKARIFINGEYRHRSDLGETDLKKISPEIQEKILDKLKQEIENYQGIILSDYNKRIFNYSFAQEIIKLANEHDIPILADPKPVNIDFFKDCSVVCPNKKEAQEITEISYFNNEDVLFKIGERLKQRTSSRYTVITCGEDGAYVYYDGKSKMEKTIAKKVVDSTGAGDTYAAVLLCGLASKLDIFKATEIANIAAGLVVQKYGTATVSMDEIERYIEKGLCE